MVKKSILLPLVVLNCFALNAWDRFDPNPSYNYDIYNYYTERSWLLPPSEYYWYFESARKAPIQNTYNYINDAPPQNNSVGSPVVVLPSNSAASGSVYGGAGPSGDYSSSGGTYRFQDLDAPGTTPIAGYEGLPWGTTIAQFRGLFPDAKEVNEAQNVSPRIRRFSQHSLDNAIQDRQFLFLNEQLYEVYVLYGYVGEAVAAAMQERLAGLYGLPFDVSRRTERYENIKYDLTDTYMSNSSDMQVVLTICDVSENNNTPQGKIMSCLFTNPQVRAE